MTAAQKENLWKSLKEFGDLGGITINLDGEIISGHQRVDAMLRDPGLKIVSKSDHPSAGTVAEYTVCLSSGQKFVLRQVSWSEEKASLARLRANKGGEWNVPLLADNLKELHFAGADLDLTGFDAAERASLFNKVPEWGNHEEDTIAGEARVTVCPSCGHEWAGK